MADQSWQQQPFRMSLDVVQQAAERMAKHAAVHQLPAISVILHGGEPLLAGVDHIGQIVEIVRQAVPSETAVGFSMQTNGTLLNEKALRLFDELDIHLAVSLDGDRNGNDRHRRHKNGRGSYDEVVQGIELLRSDKYRRLFSGLLCAVDVRNNPIDTYESLIAFNPPVIDFLLPHGTWDEPPPFVMPGRSDSPYGDWLVEIFNRWYDAKDVEVDVRIFRSIMRVLLGSHSTVETIGLSPSALVVIETDGSFEQVDALKSTFEGATKTGATVFKNDLDELLLQPGIVARQIGVEALSDVCRSCTYGSVCGGGYFPHRYRKGTGFRHPSVFCADLYRVISHIHRRMQAEIDAQNPDFS